MGRYGYPPEDDIVLKTLFDANTILAANTDDTPVALPIAASRIVGRKATGNIAAMTTTELTTLMALGQLGATAYVIASDAPAYMKAFATMLQTAGAPVWVCDGTADEVEIQAAINALPDRGGPAAAGTKTGRIVLMGHHFVLASQLDVPPVQDFVFDARGTLTSGEGIRLDSSMDAWYYFGVISGETGNIGLDIDPKTLGPDNLKVFVDSRVYWSSIANNIQGTGGSVGLRLDPTNGSILSSVFEGINIHGFETLFKSLNPGGGLSFLGNEINPGQLYTGTTGVQDGEAGASGHTGNRYELHFAGALTTGVSIYGDNSIYTLVSSYSGAATTPTVFQSGASSNLVMAETNSSTFTDSSGVNTNKVLTPATHRAILAVTGSQAYAAATGPFIEFVTGTLSKTGENIPAPRVGVLKNLVIRISANTLDGTCGVYLHKANGASGVEKTISAGQTGTLSDTIHSVQVVTGDLIKILISLPGGAGSITITSISIDFE